MNSSSATVGADNYPAKYSWTAGSPSAANCAGGATPDYVAYNTNVAGSSTQASIIAYENLYSGTCSGSVPQTYWAYDTGGTIETSVALSELGDQVAFIHSASTASLVLLKWSATGGAFTGSPTGTSSKNITSVSIACTYFPAGTPLYGPGIATGATVASCSGTAPSATIVMSANATASGTTVPLTYNNQFTGTLNSTTSVTTSTTGICSVPNIVGSPIYGTGIPQGDTISGCTTDTPSTITLTPTAATTSGSETLSFSPATAAAPVVLTANTNANYKGCVAPCMTIISFSSNNDTISSPFVDYVGDNLYVGDASGNLHQFTHVFLGSTAPAAGFTVSAGSSSHPLTSPVYDPSSNLVYVSNYNSNLAEVTPTGTVTYSASFQSGATPDVQEGPLVDSTAGKVYVFEEGPSSYNFIDQLPTNFTSGATAAVVDFGAGGSHILYSGNFDNAYYTSSSGTGNLYVCGNTGGSPVLYQIPITSGTMSTTANTGPTLTSGSTTCSPLSEVYNSGATGGPYDWIYAGVDASGSPSGCSSSGCVMGVTVTSWLKGTSYSTGQMVVDNHFNIEVVTSAAGTSGSTTPSWPAAGSAGTATTDNTVTWTSEGPFTFTGFTTGGHTYTKNTVIVDTNNNLERVTTAGTAASSAPSSWNKTFGGTTTSGTVTFTNQGPLGIVGSEYDGGTSGIVIDNISTAAGASNIYFSTLGTGSTGSCATTPGTYGGCAIQASQSAP
jgi:hypothetical protein